MSYEEEPETGNLETIATGRSRIEDSQGRWMFDLSFDLLEIEARLKGGIVTYEKARGEYVFKKLKGTKPLMNDTGVMETMSTLNLAMTKIQALSDLDIETILAMTRSFGMELGKLYAVNMIKFGMTAEKASLIHDIIVGMYHSNLKKSFGAAALKAMRDTERIVESRQTVNKQGLLRRIF